VTGSGRRRDGSYMQTGVMMTKAGVPILTALVFLD
jgi:hypothetical protein